MPWSYKSISTVLQSPREPTKCNKQIRVHIHPITFLFLLFKSKLWDLKSEERGRRNLCFPTVSDLVTCQGLRWCHKTSKQAISSKSPLLYCILSVLILDFGKKNQNCHWNTAHPTLTEMYFSVMIWLLSIPWLYLSQTFIYICPLLYFILMYLLNLFTAHLATRVVLYLSTILFSSGCIFYLLYYSLSTVTVTVTYREK